MHNRHVQRTLIAFIKREMPDEWSSMRKGLREEFAELMAGVPSHAARRDLGRLYARRMAAMVIATARYLSIHR